MRGVIETVEIELQIRLLSTKHCRGYYIVSISRKYIKLKNFPSIRTDYKPVSLSNF